MEHCIRGTNFIHCGIFHLGYGMFHVSYETFHVHDMESSTGHIGCSTSVGRSIPPCKCHGSYTYADTGAHPAVALVGAVRRRRGGLQRREARVLCGRVARGELCVAHGAYLCIARAAGRAARAARCVGGAGIAVGRCGRDRGQRVCPPRGGPQRFTCGARGYTKLKSNK